jgi:hypothetical protein
MHSYMSPESRPVSIFNLASGSILIPGIPCVCFIKSVSDKVSTNEIPFYAVCALAFLRSDSRGRDLAGRSQNGQCACKLKGSWTPMEPLIPLRGHAVCMLTSRNRSGIFKCLRSSRSPVMDDGVSISYLSHVKPIPLSHFRNINCKRSKLLSITERPKYISLLPFCPALYHMAFIFGTSAISKPVLSGNLCFETRNVPQISDAFSGNSLRGTPLKLY